MISYVSILFVSQRYGLFSGWHHIRCKCVDERVACDRWVLFCYLSRRTFLTKTPILQLSDINWTMVNQCRANNWSRIYVILSRHIHNTVANVRSACRFCTWAGTNTTAINCTNRTRAVTMVAGRQHASATIQGYGTHNSHLSTVKIICSYCQSFAGCCFDFEARTLRWTNFIDRRRRFGRQSAEQIVGHDQTHIGKSWNGHADSCQQQDGHQNSHERRCWRSHRQIRENRSWIGSDQEREIGTKIVNLQLAIPLKIVCLLEKKASRIIRK